MTLPSQEDAEMIGNSLARIIMYNPYILIFGFIYSIFFLVFIDWIIRASATMQSM